MWETGGRIRVLIAYDPKWKVGNDLLEALVYNHKPYSETPNDYLELVKKFDRFLEFTTKSQNGGLVEIKRRAYFPAVSYMITNRKEDDGKVKVEIYTTCGENGNNKNRPHFFVHKNNVKDREWFDFFVCQFEKLWNGAISI